MPSILMSYVDKKMEPEEAKKASEEKNEEKDDP